MSLDRSPRSQADDFLKTAHLYQLGQLPTEASHPQTRQLSELAQKDLHQAVKLLRHVDIQALERLKDKIPSLDRLNAAIVDTLNSGSRIFLCGCGATGRLSLSLEYLWRETHIGPLRNQVVSFMAGGDVALVHSLEGFEDYPEYGAEQLRGLGFGANDLLISCTEGGETPFVIGATLEAQKLSRRPPFFLYCNPKDELCAKVERSKRVLEDPKIENICLFVGPMAISGSTRMQASTVLMLAVGMALLERRGARDLTLVLAKFLDDYRDIDLSPLAGFIEEESGVYQVGDRVLYDVSDFAITVFTDTTERAPTFSLPPFNNSKFPRPHHSLSFVSVAVADSVEDAWKRLLAREPRVLNWPERSSKTTLEYLRGFDFSNHAIENRKRDIPNSQHFKFEIHGRGDDIVWRLKRREWSLPRLGSGLLWHHILLKMALNIHSTLVMGRLGRYQGNLMTWVQPTNGKLIDRASRYILALAEMEGLSFSYEDAVRALFDALPECPPSEAVVPRALARLKK